MAASPKPEVGTAVARRGPTSVDRSIAGQQLATLTTERAKRLIQPMLAQGVTYERVLSEVYFAIQSNPQLVDCTPDSLIMAVAKCSAWDLEIGTKAHLVPFNVKVKVRDEDGREKEEWQTRCQAIRDYKGDADLVVRCGAARYVDAHNVYSEELFEYELGTSPFIKHRPIIDPEKRGKLIASYAVARVNAWDVKLVVLSREEIDEVRLKHSKSWKEHWVNGQKVPYTLEAIRWYGPKTCVHRVVKLLPTNPRLAAVLKSFEEEERILDDPTAVMDPQIQISTGTPDGPAVREVAQRHLMPAADAADPYRTDAAAPVQVPREVMSEPATPRTAAQRAAAAAAANAPDPFRHEEPSAPAFATAAQKATIAELLNTADLADKEREKFARVAGSTKKPMTAARADDMIAYLTKLVPQQSAQTEIEGTAAAPPATPSGAVPPPGRVEDALEKNVAAKLAAGDEDDGLPF